MILHGILWYKLMGEKMYYLNFDNIWSSSAYNEPQTSENELISEFLMFRLTNGLYDKLDEE
jgi:hypothetical protein